MSPLKEACLIAKKLDQRDLEMLKLFVDLLYEIEHDRKPSVGLAPMSESTELGQITSPITKRKYKTRVKVKKRKARKLRDPAEVLAGKRGPRLKGNDNASTPDKYRGLKARVHEALLQTTGKVTSVELAEILDVKTQKVSEVLSSGFKSGSIKGLFREAGRTEVNGKQMPTYFYWLDGALK